MSEPSPEELIARVRRVYAACRSYRDHGERWESCQGTRTRIQHSFSTAFVRPDRFRFESSMPTAAPEDEWVRWAVLSNARGVRSWFSFDSGVRPLPSIAAGFGGWRNTGHLVPRWLLGQEGEPVAWGRPGGVELRGRGAASGHECWALDYARFQGRSMTLWIDVQSLLLRRIDEEVVHDEEQRAWLKAQLEQGVREASDEEARVSRQSALEYFERTPMLERLESTTTLEPVLDAEIDPATFEEPAAWCASAPTVPAAPRDPAVGLQPVPEGTPSVATWLARIRARYSACRSYRDRGCVTTVYFPTGPGSRKHTEAKPFATDFMRPARLRFEYRDELSGPDVAAALVIASEGGVRSACDREAGIRTFPTILGALGTFAGVSSGSSVIVPCLLLPREELADPLPSPESSRWLGQDRAGGCECLVLRGNLWNGRGVTLWVGAEDLLLRRVAESLCFDEAAAARQRSQLEEDLRTTDSPEHRRTLEQLLAGKFRPFRSETDITYQPELDVDLPPELFAAPVEWGTA